MGGIRQYAVTVVTAAIICSILSCMVSQDSFKRLLHLVSGLVLTLVILKPLSEIELPPLESIALPKMYMGESAVEEGKELARDSMMDIIKTTCEAYILDKATDLDAQINVSVSVNSDYVPFSAAISGTISPSAKKQLEIILETDLGIAKENQTWTG